MHHAMETRSIFVNSAEGAFSATVRRLLTEETKVRPAEGLAQPPHGHFAGNGSGMTTLRPASGA